jgi:NADPH-dependent 2,4-dienoyl-CoA reductase/sulfur reductase-like enzyme
MSDYKYLIVGAGMTADNAVKGIRELDSNGSIGVIGKEPDPPYNRPPLSKGLWKGKSVDDIWLKTKDQSVDFILGRSVQSIDPNSRTVTDDQGNIYSYEKLLLANGGKPRTLPFGGEEILYYRTLEHYRRLREMIAEKDHFAVIGGGFIGSEIAAALNMNGKKVTMLFPEDGIGGRIFPGDLSLFLNDYYRQKGVEVLAGSTATNLQKDGNTLNLLTGKGKEIAVDGVVAGIGILPNIELAKTADLKVNNGVIVDEMLRTSQPDIFAAGDVAEFYQPALGKRLRVEHEDNAYKMGKQAGRNMAGASEPYHHLPFFYSDLFDLGYEAVGELDSRLETFSDWKEPYKEGVIYYLADGRVRGVLLWNVWGALQEARALIAEPGPFDAENLKSRLGS